MPVLLRQNPKTKNGNFNKIPNYLLRGMGEVSDMAFRLYMFLHSQAQDFNPTQNSVAKGLNWSIAKVKRAYKELHDKGYLILLKTENTKKMTYLLLEQPIDPESYKAHKKLEVQK